MKNKQDSISTISTILSDVKSSKKESTSKKSKQSIKYDIQQNANQAYLDSNAKPRKFYNKIEKTSKSKTSSKSKNSSKSDKSNKSTKHNNIVKIWSISELDHLAKKPASSRGKSPSSSMSVMSQ